MNDEISRSDSLFRLHALRTSLGWTLVAQIVSILSFWGYNYAVDVLLIRPFDELTVAKIRLGLVAFMICTVVFAGGRLMKIVAARQESEGKPVTLNNFCGLYAWFLVFFPLLGLLAPRFGPMTQHNPMILLPVLGIPLYATVPLLFIRHRLERFLSGQFTEK